MVAVSERVSKAMKLLPDNLKWNGQHDTYDAFIDQFNEWVEIRLVSTVGSSDDAKSNDPGPKENHRLLLA